MKKSIARAAYHLWVGTASVVLAMTLVTLATDFRLTRPLKGIAPSGSAPALADLSPSQASQLESVYNWVSGGSARDCVFVQGPAPAGHGTYQQVNCPASYKLAVIPGSWLRADGRLCTPSSDSAVTQYNETPVNDINFKCNLVCCK